MTYSKNFFKSKESGAVLSARKVIPILLDFFPVRSVVDFGCGNGTWLKVFLENGVENVRGFDGEWVKKEDLLIQEDQFSVINFENIGNVESHADLAMSLEVAEHLTTNAAKNLIRLLCSNSEIVLFSAAIPGQGGTHHINEQWPTYWIQEFNNHNYKVVDVLRWKVWDDNEVETWYKQNILMFISASLYKQRTDLLETEKSLKSGTYNFVHPKSYSGKIKELNNLVNHSFSKILFSLPSILKKKALFKIRKGKNK